VSTHSHLDDEFEDRRRWYTVAVLCLAVLMIGINATIINIALPPIRTELHFTDGSLVWVVNAYLIFFGGFLLLGGRLGDILGRRRLLLLGILVFAIASLGCGLATSAVALVVARAMQGIGGAITSAVALSEIANVFEDAPRRSRALGIYVFVNAAGGSLGHLLSGVLTGELGWRWIFLINGPLGAAAYALCVAYLPKRNSAASNERLDVAGAIVVTTLLILGVYGVVNWNDGVSVRHSVLVVGIGLLLVLFVFIEASVHKPLVPLRLFRARNLAATSIAGILFLAALLGWSFFSALYLQRVLRFDALQVAVLLLPANVIIAMMSLAVTPKLIVRLGNRCSVVLGMLTASAALAFLGRVAADASVILDLLPATLVLGVGAGMAYNPLYVAALGSVSPSDSGAASGVVTTAFTLGGALGLSLLVSVSAARTHALAASGMELQDALTAGYQMAFYSAAAFAAAGALVGGLCLRDAPQFAEPGRERASADSSADL